MSRYRPAVPGFTEPASKIAARFRRQELREIDAKRVADAVRETGELPDDAKSYLYTEGGDAEKLRGIPAIGHGVGGTQRGTDPLRETIRRDNQRRRNAERTTLEAQP